MKDIPNSGMVTTMDIGDPIFIHPADKETVGNRLAYWALGKAYGKITTGYAPPIYKSMEVIDTSVVVSFENVEHGICPINTEIKGFEIAGEDKIFYPAIGFEKSGDIIISSKNVKKPIAVRYAYKNYTEATLFNAYGIPASPFRTDNW